MRNHLNKMLWGLVLALCGLFAACKKTSTDNKKPIEQALNSFVDELIKCTFDSTNISGKIENYMLSQPNTAFGATVALLNTKGKVYYSPYWYRSTNKLVYKNLSDSAYMVDQQAWLRQPIDLGVSVWSEPYFDAGGGEIWMQTLSVPIKINGVIVAVATTDMAVKQ